MYTLIWLGRALNQLANIYVRLDLDQQRRLADVVDAFNQRLRTQPLAEGESRGESLRIAFPELLAVRFRVNETDQTVRVTNVKRYGG